MTDIIEQAEAALDAVKLTGNDPVGSVGLINALLAGLKATRAENGRLQRAIDRIDETHTESQMFPGRCCGCEYGASWPCVTASQIDRLHGGAE